MHTKYSKYFHLINGSLNYSNTLYLLHYIIQLQYVNISKYHILMSKANSCKITTSSSNYG